MERWLSNRKLWAVTIIVFVAVILLMIDKNDQAAERKAASEKTASYFTKHAGRSGTAESDVKTVRPPAKLIVDMKGAVRRPGIYTMTAGDRVSDAVARAGGITAKADENRINLAQKVADEMVIFVPEKGKKSPPQVSGSPGTAASPQGTSSSGPSGGQININSADEQALQNLTGIGPAKAKAIVQYREQHGPFKSVDDLNNVSGIGDKSLEKIKPEATVQ
jgi:competence protein ComEA